MTHDELRVHLRDRAFGWRLLMKGKLGPWIMEEFVLREGISCVAQPLPPGMKRGPMKQCFHNTWKLVRRKPRLLYCEGYAAHEDFRFAFHHAWAIDIDWRVLDTTLVAPERYAYLGVPIPRHDLLKHATADNPSVLLTRSETYRVDYMLERCPILREMIEPD